MKKSKKKLVRGRPLSNGQTHRIKKSMYLDSRVVELLKNMSSQLGLSQGELIDNAMVIYADSINFTHRIKKADKL